MANDVEHLFVCFLILCVSSLSKRLFKSFAQFFIGLFDILLLSGKSSLCILDKGSLRLAKTLFHCGLCFSSLVPFET